MLNSLCQSRERSQTIASIYSGFVILDHLSSGIKRKSASSVLCQRKKFGDRDIQEEALGAHLEPTKTASVEFHPSQKKITDDLAQDLCRRVRTVAASFKERWPRCLRFLCLRIIDRGQTYLVLQP